MSTRKRAARPIEIALTEEQIESIIAEAAAHAGRPFAAWEAASSAAGGYPALAGASFAAEPVYQGFSPLSGKPAGDLPRGTLFSPLPPASGASESGEVPEEGEIEEHRRKVLRQMRGRDAGPPGRDPRQAR